MKIETYHCDAPDCGRTTPGLYGDRGHSWMHGHVGRNGDLTDLHLCPDHAGPINGSFLSDTIYAGLQREHEASDVRHRKIVERTNSAADRALTSWIDQYGLPKNVGDVTALVRHVVAAITIL